VVIRAVHERSIVLALCVAAACRVFLFSAAFPYFNNVDEPAHFDLVMKYWHGEMPRRGVERFSREANGATQGWAASGHPVLIAD